MSAARVWSAPAPLTTLSAIHRLTNAEASEAVPVAFEATVTYFRDYERTLFVQDGDNAIYVLAPLNQRLDPGDRILIRGFTRDSFRPVVVGESITLLHHGSAPQPAEVEFTPLIQAKFDCHYVTVRGTVISAVPTLSSGHITTLLHIGMHKGTVEATVDRGTLARLSDLIGAEVAVTGAESGNFDGKMQQTGILVHVTSFDDVHILHKAPVDAWSVPLTPMDQVLNSYDVDDHTPRVRVQGVITYFQSGQMAVLQDGDRSLRVLTKSIEPLNVGDRAEAIGEPFVEDGFLTLQWGDFRTTGDGAAPVNPVLVNWDQLASGRHAFDLVSIEGKVVTQVREHARDLYIIAADGHLFSASVRYQVATNAGGIKAPPPMAMIPTGSRVRVTGVVMHDDANPFNGPMPFTILLRSAGDVVVLAHPSWLNVENLIMIVGGLLILVAGGSAWVMLLRRKVHEQTTELAARKEAEAILERKRSRILENINGTVPLEEILQQITEFAAFRLDGAPCWCEIGDGIRFGNVAAETAGLNVIRQEIPSRSGPLHGHLLAAIALGAPCTVHAQEAMAMGAWLATLAIETRGLYSDLVHRSEFDLLTDVFNRFSFERRVDSLIETARQSSANFGLVYIDLDDFKQVNDQYGHRAGDQFLQQTAHRMKRQLRPSDMLARLGGDEFAVLLPNVRGPNDVEEVASRLQRCFADPLPVDGYMLRGSVSIGTALYPDDGSTKDSLLSAADAAMYVEKKIKKESGQSLHRR
jgi:diguanylate cyclase (GGDEF)-like protein